MRFSILVASVFFTVLLAHSQPQLAAENQTMDLFSVDVQALVAEFGESNIVARSEIRGNDKNLNVSRPRVVMPEGCEGYLLAPKTKNAEFQKYKIIGRKPAGKAISGVFYCLRPSPTDTKPAENVLAKFEFFVDEHPSTVVAMETFHRAKGLHFRHLWSEEMAGAAMFRHLALESLKHTTESTNRRRPSWPRPINDNVDRTIALMTGGRAVSENLQLDQQLSVSPNSDVNWVQLSTIRGVTVREIDWKARLGDKKVELDALAILIPHDQYAIFLPSFESMVSLIDQGKALATPVMQAMEPNSRRVDMIGFYQRQLGLPINVLTRQVGENLISEVAITGSDPYFRTGTDIAVILQTEQPGVLAPAIEAQIAASATDHKGVSKTLHSIDGATYTEWSNPSRSCCSMVGIVGESVVVSNSAQLMVRLLQCSKERIKSLDELNEYRYFRDRYQKTDDETAFVMVTDATIRKWCGPVWRIGASRRTRARASIAEITMRYADDLVHQSIKDPVQVHDIAGLPDAGKMSVLPEGVVSSTYGTMRFQRPIAEMNLTRATRKEVQQYTRWRNQYERLWRNKFDPIGFQIRMKPNSINVDLSVIPLNMRTEYRWWEMFVGNSTLKPDSGDAPDQAAASLLVAMDPNGQLVQMAKMFLAQSIDADLFGWLDESAQIYLDADEKFLIEFASQKDASVDSIHKFVKLPVGLHIPSKDTLKLTAFMVALRAYVDRSAPNLLTDSLAEYKNMNYVVLTSAIMGNGNENPNLYYVTTTDGITISWNRSVIEKAIDRHIERKKNKQPAATPENNSPFPAQARMVFSGAAVRAILAAEKSNRNLVNRAAWSNLPILNYFRSRYPDHNPQQVYQILFGEHLFEPTGGDYIWNNDHQTFQSTHHGHHLNPSHGPLIGPLFRPADKLSTAVTFAGDGVRANVSFDKQKRIR